MRVTWNAPEGRFFDTGLDRGILYPKGTPPLGPIVRTNMIPNPEFTVGTTGYAAGAGAVISRTTAWDPTGALRIEVSGTPTGDSFASIGGDAGGLRLGMVAGKTYTISADINTPNPLTAPLHERARRIVLHHKTAAAPGYTTEMSSPGPASGEARLSLTFTLPEGTTDAFIRLYNGSAVNAQALFWDNILMVEGASPEVKATPFFSGATEDTGAYIYEWVGDANNSLSTKREVLTYAVPWTGLSSVDEEGGDGASAYYVDGRPFLFLPKPKEYKATLKAYTYPDAFADIMGVTEVADGMYLDSQPGKAFDLCYRTLVGNATEGVDHGYKIHLVYNATVTPQALTYESLSNSINPTTFSWEIQAVPVRVEGFRPTAHIVIDTRHMDQKKIDAVEALLYGSEDEIPHMPSPQVIFDLLSFGDTIIVTDNGDGTFDVIGSYENVYMVGPGIFRVDNVDGQDNGDGTFTISTTTV